MKVVVFYDRLFCVHAPKRMFIEGLGQKRDPFIVVVVCCDEVDPCQRDEKSSLHL